jgi:hypothetical protein
LILLAGTARVFPQAPRVYYVDGCRPPGDGSQSNPFNMLTLAVERAAAGSTLVVQRGSYPERPTIRKNLTITASGGPVLVGQPARTQKICQLTGEFDRERQQPTINRTETNNNLRLRGTDLGASFEHNGRIYFLFGDTHPSDRPFDPSRRYNPNEPRPFNGDSIAWTTDTDPEQCLHLNFLRAPDRGYLSPKVRVLSFPPTFLSLGGFEVPTGGFSANGRMYVFFTTDNSDQNVMGRSVLARLVDESQNLFTYLYDVSCRPGVVPCAVPDVGKFINISPVIVNNADIPGLPQSTGQGLLLWGSGRYRESSPYLAYLPLGAVEDRRMLRYYAGIDARTGRPVWSSEESQAVKLFDQDCIGELSVTWNLFLRKWLMLYNCGNPRGINYRVADQPWGPWSPPAVLFDPWCDRGHCHFMHAGGDLSNCDSVDDEMFRRATDPPRSRVREPGGEYGPYVISRFTKGDATSTTIYYLMSTWNPYQVVLMKSTLPLR